MNTIGWRFCSKAGASLWYLSSKYHGTINPEREKVRAIMASFISPGMSSQSTNVALLCFGLHDLV